MAQSWDNGRMGAKATRDVVRERPGMWIGSTGPLGLTVLVLEVLENAVDLVLGGRASAIEVVVHEDSSLEVRDDGPGLNLSDATVRKYFEEYHESATADGHHPHVHLWGAPLGLFVVNALSSRLRVDSVHDGVHRAYEWSDGGDVCRPVEASSSDRLKSQGTAIRFWPDHALFGKAQPDIAELAKRLQELDCLLPELNRLAFTVNRESQLASTGLLDLMRTRLRVGDRTWTYVDERTDTDDDRRVELAVSVLHAGLKPAQRMQEQLLVFCNFREVTEQSGVHRAIRGALGSADGAPIRGLALVCSLRMLSPEFSGPTKGRMRLLVKET